MSGEEEGGGPKEDPSPLPSSPFLTFSLPLAPLAVPNPSKHAQAHKHVTMAAVQSEIRVDLYLELSRKTDARTRGQLPLANFNVNPELLLDKDHFRKELMKISLRNSNGEEL